MKSGLYPYGHLFPIFLVSSNLTILCTNNLVRRIIMALYMKIYSRYQRAMKCSIPDFSRGFSGDRARLNSQFGHVLQVRLGLVRKKFHQIVAKSLNRRRNSMPCLLSFRESRYVYQIPDFFRSDSSVVFIGHSDMIFPRKTTSRCLGILFTCYCAMCPQFYKRLIPI